MAVRLAPGIVQDPEILHGKPVVEGTRVPVSQILGHLAAGDGMDEVAAEYGLTRDDVLACLAYGAQRVASKRLKTRR